MRNSNKYLSIAFNLLLVLVSLTPVFSLGTGSLEPQCLGLAAAAILLLLANAPENDVQRVVAIFTPGAPAALLLPAWMLLQIAPVPLSFVAHSIWQSASGVFPDGLYGHVSIDLGFTLRAFFLLVGLCSLAFSTAVLARDRDRAELIVLILCSIATLVAIELILLRAFGSSQLIAEARPSLEAITAFGVILGAAYSVHVRERRETRSTQSDESWPYLLQLLTSGAAALLCLFSLLASAAYTVVGAMAFGLVTLFLVILIRRLNLRLWTAAVVAGVAFVTCCAIIALRFAANTSQTAIVLFSSAQPDAATAALRMLSDAGWAGAGVGTYGPLAAIYRDASGLPDRLPINTVTSMILGWGYVGMALVAVVCLQLLFILLRGAFSRGRDYLYAAAAAATLVTAALELYCDTSLTELAPQIFVAVIIGLGMAQTVGTKPR
jgi:hypothetical protein